MVKDRGYVYNRAGDRFGRLFGLMWSLSVLLHIVFFAVFVITASAVSKAESPKKTDALVFELADLPKGPGIGFQVPHSQNAALNPFQGRPVSTQDRLKESDMPMNVKPEVKANSKFRSRETRPEVKVQDKMAQSAIDRLRQMKEQLGGGGEGAGSGGGSIASLYLAKVREKIRSRWKLPSGLSDADMDRSAKVVITIDAAGNLMSASITSGSGHAALDASIQAAISKATPFTQPPLEMAGKVAGSGIAFTFKAKEAK